MIDDPGGFLAAGIRAIAADVPEGDREALRQEIRAKRLSLREQLALVALAAERLHTLASTVYAAVAARLRGLPERPAALQRAREAADRQLGEGGEG